MIERQHIFFDLDGTLTDPAPGLTASIIYALRAVGHADPPEAEALRGCIGPPLRDSFERLLDTRDARRLDAAIAAYRSHYGEVGLYACRLVPGISAVLEALEARPGKRYVVTAKPTLYADRIVDHFGLRRHFAAVYGPDLDGAGSEKSELVARVLESESISARDAVMIGDRKHDVLGARANGVASIGVLWGYGGVAELDAAGADHLVERPSELIGLLGEEARG